MLQFNVCLVEFYTNKNENKNVTFSAFSKTKELYNYLSKWFYKITNIVYEIDL